MMYKITTNTLHSTHVAFQYLWFVIKLYIIKVVEQNFIYSTNFDITFANPVSTEGR